MTRLERISAGILTLMTPEPTGGYYKTAGVESFVRKFGYPDMTGQANREDRLNFGGIHRVGTYHPRTGLAIDLQGFDIHAGKIRDATGGIALINRNGDEAAVWHFTDIMQHWNRKHAQAVYIPSISNKIPDLSYSYGNIIRLGLGTDFLLYLRDANIKFIKQFQSDYQAKTFYLVENYRSSAHIIAASNCLIAHNSERMKGQHPIRINKGREKIAPGGQWKTLDPISQGRVQLFKLATYTDQAVVTISELKRIKQRNPAVSWSDFAVLARRRDELAPIRALLEHYEIPVSWGIDRDKTPPLYRIREVVMFIQELKSRSDELLKASDLLSLLDGLVNISSINAWWLLLKEILLELQADTANAQLPVSYFIEYIYETLAEQRRDQAVGNGIFLSTVHSAKGMEFPHVFVLGGGWSHTGKLRELEEDRRVYYVAMTRAKETLSLFERNDAPNPHTRLIEGDFLLQRETPQLEHVDANILQRKYDVLSLKDFFINYAGHKKPEDSLHKKISALCPGDTLSMVTNNHDIDLINVDGDCVAKLSKEGISLWSSRIRHVESLKVIAMIQRYIDDSGEEFRSRCQSECWEIPLVEVVYRDTNV